MPDVFPPLPDELKSDIWKKKKSKLAPATGIGEELKGVEKTYAGIKQRAITPLTTAFGPDEMEGAIKEAKAEFPNIEKTRKALLEFAKFATKKAGEAKKSAVFPKETRMLIEKMAEAAGNLAVAIRDTPDRWVKQGEEQLKHYDADVVLKNKMVDAVHTALLKHARAAEALQKQITDILKEAVTLAKGGQIREGKIKVNDAAKLLPEIDKLIKACEDDSKEWRTDKTKLSKADNLKLVPKANEIMQANKQVHTIRKSSDEAIRKVLEVLAKLPG